MSNTTVLHPIVACLQEAKSFLKTEDVWHPVNDTQETFFDNHYNDDTLKMDDVLDALATTDNEELMKFFSERGFDFDISPFKPKEFGVGSVISVLVEWLEEQTQTIMMIDDVKYDAVHVKNNYGLFSSANHSHSVVKLLTKTDDVVYLTIADKPYEGLELVAKINEIRSDLQPDHFSYDGVRFPMVDLDQDVNIDWILGADITNEDGVWRVSQAEQKTRFKMNHVGAKAESAVSMIFGLATSVPNPILYINQPFFVWIERPGVKDPLFSGYITQEDWKNPGDIS